MKLKLIFLLFLMAMATPLSAQYPYKTTQAENGDTVVDRLGKIATVENPQQNAVAVTPSDTVDLATPSRAIYVGGAGDVKVNMVGTGAGVTFKAVPVGTVLRVQAKRVYATGTTATSLVELY